MTNYSDNKSDQYSVSGTMQKEPPDATANSGCYSCEKARCTCGNNEEYIKKLVACITKEVMDKIGN
jgi:hypothetical protein